MPKVTFIKGGETTVADVKRGENLLEAAQGAGVEMLSACGGMGVCTTCMVEVKDNKEALSEVTESEQVMGFEADSDHRLGCQACVKGDVTVALS